MTPTTLAETILRDVKRYSLNMLAIEMFETPHGGWVRYSDVLAALSRALDPAIAERAGEVLEGVSDAPWRVGHLESYEMSGLAFRRVYFPTASEGEIHEAHIRGEDCDENARFIAWCREGVPALLAQIAVLLAERDGWKQWSENWRDSAQRCLAVAEKQEARAEAAEAEVEKLRGALEWYAKDGWNDRSLEPPTPEEVEVFGDNILDFPMPEIFFDRGERARAALTETATTEEGK